jgi:hypothetical protein
LVPLPHLAFPALPRYLFNAFLAVFIINYSFFSRRGWWSVAFDLAYLYFFPFIWVAKALWWLTKLFFRVLKEKTVVKAPQLIATKVATAAVAKPPTVEVQTPPDARGKGNFREGIIRAFSKFALLWSVLIVTVNYKPFLVVAVLVTLIGAGRAFRALWDLFSGDAKWMVGLEERIAAGIRKQVDLILQWDGDSDIPELKKQVNSAKLQDSILSFIQDNRILLSKWAWAISLTISLPFYCYVSYLFACAYFGIGKIEALRFPFATAFLDSLYMPFAWSDLPKSFVIKFIAGLQAIFISAVGWTIFFRHLGARFEKVAIAAARLRGPFEDEMVRQRLIQLQARLSQDVLPAPKASKGKTRRQHRK